MQCSPVSVEIASPHINRWGREACLGSSPDQERSHPHLHQSRSRRHSSPEMSHFLLSALVRDGGVVGGHHSCNNYWPGNGTADRIATRRLRHSGSFAAGSPRALQESGKWVGSSRRSGRCDIEITFPGATCPPDEAFSTPLELDRYTATATRA